MINLLEVEFISIIQMVPSIFFHFCVCCNKLSVISVLSLNAKLLAFYRSITSDVDRQRLELVDRADDELFEKVLGIGQPTSRYSQFCAQRNSVKYGLRCMRHNRELYKSCHLLQFNFVVWMLYKDIY